MSPEERDLLFKTYQMAEENNKMLRSLRNAQRWDRVIKYGYWFIIIAASFGAYYIIQPYLQAVAAPFVRTPGGDTQKISDIQELLKSL